MRTDAEAGGTEGREKAPRSLSELLEVSGVGERKASRYGEAFLRTIEEYIQQQG